MLFRLVRMVSKTWPTATWVTWLLSPDALMIDTPWSGTAALMAFSSVVAAAAMSPAAQLGGQQGHHHRHLRWEAGQGVGVPAVARVRGGPEVLPHRARVGVVAESVDLVELHVLQGGGHRQRGPRVLDPVVHRPVERREGRIGRRAVHEGASRRDVQATGPALDGEQAPAELQTVVRLERRHGWPLVVRNGPNQRQRAEGAEGGRERAHEARRYALRDLLQPAGAEQQLLRLHLGEGEPPPVARLPDRRGRPRVVAGLQANERPRLGEGQPAPVDPGRQAVVRVLAGEQPTQVPEARKAGVLAGRRRTQGDPTRRGFRDAL